MTNEERREIAARLREDAASWLEQCPSGDADRDAWEIMGDIVLAIGFGRDQGEVRAVDLLDHLADLIDRPTCHFVRHETSGHMPNGERCDNCEEVYILEDTRDWRYCPSCGAEVIE